jgi:GTP-binding protein
MSKPYVALVGRPNTGKSTLFNKIAGQKISIVENTPGVTRDRIISEAEWCSNTFYIIDTGGIEPERAEIIPIQMRRQAELAMDMADVIILVCDGKEGPTATDKEIAAMIRKRGANCILAVNKIDNWDNVYYASSFYELNLGDPVAVSAEHSIGLGDLLDEVVARFPKEKLGEEKDHRHKIAVVGKPNAGKSTLVNTLIGENRVIVSEIAGTTRDAIDTQFTYEDETYLIIDTAGIKKKNKSYSSIDFYASVRAAKAIDRADICLLMIDAKEGVTDQDAKIAGMIKEAQKAVVIVINKWDLVEKETNTMTQMEKDVRKKLYFINYAPVVFISALNKSRMPKLMAQVKAVLSEYAKRITTGLLNDAVGDAVMMHSAPVKNGKNFKIYYASQPGVCPPTIVFSVNDKKLVTDAYTRYLEGRLRVAFGFTGSPIQIIYKNKSDKNA